MTKWQTIKHKTHKNQDQQNETQVQKNTQTLTDAWFKKGSF